MSVSFMAGEHGQPGEATQGRHFQGVRGPVLHAPGIPTQDWVPQALGASAWLSHLTEICPREKPVFLGLEMYPGQSPSVSL